MNYEKNNCIVKNSEFQNVILLWMLIIKRCYYY